MNRNDVIDQIRIVVGKVLGQEIGPLSPDDRLLDGLNLDSTSMLEILMELEDTLGFEVDIDSLDPAVFETVGSFADYIVDAVPQG
ncbi:hypothetical protein Cs7R123_62010 [Catellatospora sp. TT07R-123]|uniref:acyl carrier protein n=1 Tax=Catellatospora sp. TT07R-123 TaxID=2733863 RepID=UPI001AFCFE8B|nr:phosphopantetheine-binding protein [Catellatospora sp. TT07R-123]GHJ48859.1 hypothetical protein Cs7R123_62010 [Catellatospora sp. TT07R-123]